MRTSATLGILVAVSLAFACGGDAAKKDAKPATAKKTEPKPEPQKPEPKPETTTEPPPPDDTAGDEPDIDDGTTGDAEAAPPSEGADDGPPPEPGDFRHASFVPADTPAEHREAFLAMKQKKSDGAPVGAIGPHGIHLDKLVLGKEYAQGECTGESDHFSLAESDRVHLCLRVVHGGAIDDPLKVEWQREDKKPRSSNLTLKNPHAYLTHAWHPIKKYSEGKWTVTVTAADGTVLGQKSFDVGE